MNYVTEVASLFLERCPHVSILNSTDFVTIAEWEKQGIPLPVISKSINEICEAELSNVLSINDFAPAVRANFLTWLQTTPKEP